MNTLRNFPIILHYEDDGQVSARCRLVPDCYCTGESREIALQTMQELLKLVFGEQAIPAKGHKYKVVHVAVARASDSVIRVKKRQPVSLEAALNARSSAETNESDESASLADALSAAYRLLDATEELFRQARNRAVTAAEIETIDQVTGHIAAVMTALIRDGGPRRFQDGWRRGEQGNERVALWTRPRSIFAWLLLVSRGPSTRAHKSRRGAGRTDMHHAPSPGDPASRLE